MSIRTIAFYLPQYHPIDENDMWWGKGFTEWTNTVKARPRFKGHYQPHLPADLGFYDLRVPETRQLQADLAKENGIYGFCYYHYWFNGRRILDRPFKEVFESGKPDFPFMLCWANENWTRIWDGSDNDILLKQNYSLKDDRQHIQGLIPYFKDERYIRINGKPVFVVYKSTLLPNPAQTITIWREEASKEGLELYICRIDSFGNEGTSYMRAGFDASVEFQPFSTTLSDFRKNILTPRLKFNLLNRSILKWYHITGNKRSRDIFLKKMFSHIDYNEFVDYLKKTYKYPEDYIRFPGVTPSWDNTARRGELSFIFKNANPEKYKEWLNFHCQNFKPPSEEENFIFINAWNEWAEGNHLEPDMKWGNKYLEATRDALLNG
ncbi:MAG TPA: glycoside hydrolase family 99-like domain-containing protein [Aquella sp.]|nr:glycoside hydrolase family 99-like domain-containing protein [Aquella sp.]